MFHVYSILFVKVVLCLGVFHLRKHDFYLLYLVSLLPTHVLHVLPLLLSNAVRPSFPTTHLELNMAAHRTGTLSLENIPTRQRNAIRRFIASR